jgi:hypothetical protein
MWFSRKDNQF